MSQSLTSKMGFKMERQLGHGNITLKGNLAFFPCNKIIPKEKMHNVQSKRNAPLVYYLYAILVVILKSSINKSRFADFFLPTVLPSDVIIK